ncbi:MAG: HEAT repeat domain-containing protein [Armatimonadetes bacterium]|nr:HEAT repeat domain-containing protein [Armatimonadota bacterium]
MWKTWAKLAMTAVCALPLVTISSAQFTDREKEGLESALYIGHMTWEDLKYARDPFPDMPVLPFIRRGMSDPMEAAEELMALHTDGNEESFARVVEIALSKIAGAVKVLPAATPVTVEGNIPTEMKPIIGQLTADILKADEEIRIALSKYSVQELRLLIESLPVLAVEEPKVKFEFVRETPLNRDQVVSLLARMDWAKMWSATRTVTESADVASLKLAALKSTWTGKVKLNVGGLPIVIAGVGNDEHSERDARITIDLGGNDTYTGRHGAGVGYSSVLIDLSGDDKYNVPDLSIGAGVMGVGVAIDNGGNDQFTGQSINFGAGLGGAGVFHKLGGNDNYNNVALSQGFGMYGLGICLDRSGDDDYRLKLFGQGAGRTAGLGWLIDRTGTDIYFAGGLALNSPLFARAHYSFAQGYGMGYREDSGGVGGGIGLLTDGSGDDSYLGETYMQGASYWYSLGSLCDFTGQDLYSGTHYCQASAMHMTAGYLFDLNGDDTYTIKVGAGQGIGHDYGTAFLFDREGDDLYASRDARAATGVANGIGIFLDAAGIDRYANTPTTARSARGSGSLAVFADLDQNDFYSLPFTNGIATVGETWAVGYDKPTSGATGAAPPQNTPPIRPGAKPNPGDAELERLYNLATQWGVGTAQKEVQDSLEELARIGVPAFEWMLDKKLASANRLHLRAFAYMAGLLREDAARLMGIKGLNGTEIEQENIIRIATQANVTDVGALLPNYIRTKPGLRMRAVEAAGTLKAVAAIPAIQPLLFEKENPMLVRASMIALAQIGDKEAFGSAVSMLKSADLPTRKAAFQLVIKFPEQAMPIADTMLADADEFTARTAIEILNKMESMEAQAKIVDALLDPRPGVRISALQALDGRFPASAIETLKLLRDDPIPTVRAVANGVKQ